MRLIATTLLFLTCFISLANPRPDRPRPDRPRPDRPRPDRPRPGLVFVENKGQWPADVRFRADLPGGFLYLKANGLHYVFYDTRETARRHASAKSNAPISPDIRAHGVMVSTVGSRANISTEGIHPVETTFSYFSGNDPAQWAGEVRGFGEVRYRDIYPGIDLRVYAYYETLKYEFIVQPGVDPAQIRLAYDGADGLSLAENRLTVRTSVNEFRENAPFSYVSQGERAIEVATKWALSGQTAQFTFPNGYDKTLPLTVDPELVFVTFSGSRADNFGHAATYDAEGNTYVAGSVWGTGFPVSTGAFQVSYAGQTDVGIMKFSPDGSRLLYSALLGGNGVDLPHSLVVNSQNELIVMGSTASGNFPITAGAYQTQLRAIAGLTTEVYGRFLIYNVASDLFLSRLAANGASLRGSTFVGGTNNDGLNPAGVLGSIENYADEFRGEVIVDKNDDVLVASTTQSSDFPVTDGSRQGGAADGIVFRLSADLTKLQWATRIGGANLDLAHGLRIAPNGSLYVCGVTLSAGLATPGALQTQLAGGSDGYVARLLNGKLTALTYLGTNGNDATELIDIGPDNQPHVFGLSGGRYPVTAGAYSNAGSGQFVHAVNADLSRTVFSTVFGSGRAGPDISPTAFLVNTCGNIYLAGWGGTVNSVNGYNRNSSTTNLPTTPGAYKRTTNGSNFWIGIIERGAKSLLYGTFMGDTTPADSAGRDGDHVDGGTCRFDKDGTIYHAACSCRSNRFPATASAWSRTKGNSNCNNIAFKFDTDKLVAGFDTYEGTRQNVVEGCTPLTLGLQNTSVGGVRYEWVVDGKVISTNPNRPSYTFDKAGTYPVTIRAYNPLNCKLVDSTTRVIKVSPADFRVSKDTTLCAGKPISLTAQGGTTYRWTTTAASATAIANPSASSISVVTQTSTTYSVSITNAFGCSTLRNVTVRADNSFAPRIVVSSASDCATPTVLQFENNTAGADRFTWYMGVGDTLRTRTPPGTFRYPRTGTYAVVVTAYKQDCAITQRVPVNFEDFGPLPNLITANNDGKNDVWDAGIRGAKLEIYNRWGRLIYSNDSYQNDWGSNVPHSTYYYLLTTPGGTKCKGWIQVMR